MYGLLCDGVVSDLLHGVRGAYPLWAMGSCLEIE